MSDSPKLPPGWADIEPQNAVVPMQSDPLPTAPAIPSFWEDPEDLKANDDVPTKDSTFRTWVLYYIDKNPRITSKQTGRRYITLVNSLAGYLGREPMLSDLTPDSYGSFIRHRRDVDGVAAGTVHGDAEKLLALWSWVAKRHGLDRPDVLLPRRAQRVPVTWVRKEVERLYEVARAADWWVGGIPANLYFPAFIGVAVETGERHAALHQLRWDDIDLERHTVHFREGTRKGSVADNRKTITKQTAIDLRELKKESPSTPFGQMAQSSFYTPMTRLVIAAGIKRPRNKLFHLFRAYHATQVHLAGGDASAALGHTDPALVRKSYIDPTQLPSVVPTIHKPSIRSVLNRLVGGSK